MTPNIKYSYFDNSIPEKDFYFTLAIQIYFQNLLYTVTLCPMLTFACYISTLEFDWVFSFSVVKTKMSPYIQILTSSFHFIFNLFCQSPKESLLVIV